MYVGQHLILETWGMLHLWYAVEYMWSSGRKSAMGTIECHTLMHVCPAQTPFSYHTYDIDKLLTQQR